MRIKKLLSIFFFSWMAISPALSHAVEAEIQAIRARGVLRVGILGNVPGLGVYNPVTKDFQGLEVDLARIIAQRILGSSDKLEILEANSKNRAQMLNDNEIDLIISSFSITEERKRLYSFSESYYTDGTGMMVLRDSGINIFSDLNHKKVGVEQGTTSETILATHSRERQIHFTIQKYTNYKEIKQALTNREINCFVGDVGIMQSFLDRNTMILPERLSVERYGVVAKKGNTTLTSIVNLVLDKLRADGDLERITNKWFPGTHKTR